MQPTVLPDDLRLELAVPHATPCGLKMRRDGVHTPMVEDVEPYPRLSASAWRIRFVET
jgi:hypothetical protein